MARFVPNPNADPIALQPGGVLDSLDYLVDVLFFLEGALKLIALPDYLVSWCRCRHIIILAANGHSYMCNNYYCRLAFIISCFFPALLLILLMLLLCCLRRPGHGPHAPREVLALPAVRAQVRCPHAAACRPLRHLPGLPRRSVVASAALGGHLHHRRGTLPENRCAHQRHHVSTIVFTFRVSMCTCMRLLM
jgi:hypothetical protein